jgi:hypothetical protein
MDINPSDEKFMTHQRNDHVHTPPLARTYGVDEEQKPKASKRAYKPNKPKTFRRFLGFTVLAALLGFALGTVFSYLLLSGAIDPLSHMIKYLIHLKR